MLMMGSSHTEALNVPQDQNASAQLQVSCSEAGYPGAVYNIGVSSHTFARNAANLPRALDKFQPTGYVVVETADVLMFTAAVHAARDDVMESVLCQKPILPCPPGSLTGPWPPPCTGSGATSPPRRRSRSTPVTFLRTFCIAISRP